MIQWISSQLFLLVHRFLVMPFAVTLAFFVGFPFFDKVRKGIQMRMPLNGKLPWLNFSKNTRPIWIHCASGEFEYAKPVIRELKRKKPAVPIMVTYFSPTFAKAIHKDPLVDMATPLPWDFPGPLRAFIRHHHPRALLIARTDLWPELLRQCHAARVPTGLFSATKNLNKKTLPGVSFFKKWLYNQVDVIFCNTESDREGFKQAGVKTPVQVAGDTRYDQVSYRLQHAKPVKNQLLKTSTSSFTLVAGSTWPADEAHLLKATESLIKDKKLYLVMAPHEPTSKHLDSLKALLTKHGLRFRLYTETTETDGIKPGEVLIVDTVGVLAEIYSFGDLAFVGGSFNGSVHSIMEPLAAGCMTFVGPDIKNNREGLEFSQYPLTPSRSLMAVNVCHSVMELEKKIREALDDHPPIEKWKQTLKDAVQKKQGATQKVVDWLSPHLS
ncbi:MAG: hypothetical protein H6626_02680 [Pseudobdellovibrionaceae bacterium]|nr:hypothetical protein [Bdellovibrionales bacterium]USN48012.1 MAG: hypothetical protein H6626_02680 [Pseudobdellovibrionaceae bacterium]